MTNGWSARRYWSSPSRSKVHNMWTRLYRLEGGTKYTALRRSRTIRGVSASGRRRRSRGPPRSTRGVARSFRASFARTAFSYANGKLSAAPAHECDARARALGVEADAATGAFAPANVVERIVVLGLPASPKAVTVAGRAVDFSWTAGALTIRRPDLPMAGAWAVDFTF